MSEKHTPGPWRYKVASGFDYGSTMYWLPGICTNVTTEANARLIAAAPELLEALRSVHRWMDDQADGQSKGGHATFDLLMLREQRDIAAAAIAKVEGGAA